jgi:drug/metabolite transporter (DMT)-like permease
VAVLLGACIGAYSVVDGLGVRASQSPIGYMGWLFLLEAPVVLAILVPRVVRRHTIDWPVFALGMVGGAFSVAAYGVVLYAQTIAPIAAVSAVRESSVIIAALIGVVFFGERPWVGRVLAALVVAAGVALLAVD